MDNCWKMYVTKLENGLVYVPNKDDEIEEAHMSKAYVTNIRRPHLKGRAAKNIEWRRRLRGGYKAHGLYFYFGRESFKKDTSPIFSKGRCFLYKEMSFHRDEY